jgi:hypothetical protein
MLFTIANIEATERPDFPAELMAERLIERRASPHPFPFMWVAMFRPVEPMSGVDLVLAIHYQTRSIQELEQGDWFTAKEVRGFRQEGGWTSFRKQASPRLEGIYIGPSQFLFEG